MIQLLAQIVDSYHTLPGKGIPIGNLTSQLFANVYMNELDQFVKHRMHLRYYLRYTDDFVILSNNRSYLYHCSTTLKQFLEEELELELHPGKTVLRRIEWGIDFLGYVALPYHQVLRTKTKRRIFKKIEQKLKLYRKGLLDKKNLIQTTESYLGVFKHANAYGLERALRDKIDLW